MALPPYERGMTRHPITEVPAGMRLSERSIAVAPEAQDAVRALIRSWEFKRRAGFDGPTAVPVAGAEGVLAKRVLGIRFSEPIRVVWADERGFGYETRRGHPIYGEESFVLEHGVFTARSISRPSTLVWWLLSPALRLMQNRTHARYTRVVAAEADAALGWSVRPGNGK
ncbi:DUF1990 family protein [uncultured Microbacterium sp.]|uniref:DUF1990 family protein n=1 Tax=uncultured Microbacterium sp. TaxID=191216 RepID=UPI0028DC0171|nr:DUF1990 family protein [uncultured Microbacterium sp.]